MNKITKFLILLLAVLVIAFFFLPAFIRGALLHGHAGIEDYHLFSNRSVPTAQTVRWQQDAAYNQAAIAPALLDSLKHYKTTAFVVVKEGKILHEEYFDEGSDTMRSNSFSMAKSIVSLLIGCLLEDGKIKSLDQPVSDFLPEWKGDDHQAVTLRNLLQMGSGIAWDESYSSLFSPTTRAYYGTELDELMLGLKVAEKPGVEFNYQSCNSQILGMVVRKASGTTVAAYASEKLWKPLGAEESAFWSTDHPGGMEKSYCCFNAIARDFARLGQMVLDTGKYQGRQLVPRDYILQALTPATQLRDKEGDSCYYYGLQFWKTTFHGDDVAYMRGILGQYVFVIPSRHLVIVRLGKERSPIYRNHTPLDAYTYLEAAYGLAGLPVQ